MKSPTAVAQEPLPEGAKEELSSLLARDGKRGTATPIAPDAPAPAKARCYDVCDGFLLLRRPPLRRTRRHRAGRRPLVRPCCRVRGDSRFLEV
ncbi:unnamed protein product [Urochloa humidicola]